MFYLVCLFFIDFIFLWEYKMSNSDWGVALVVTVLVLIILFILLWDRGLFTEITVHAQTGG